MRRTLARPKSSSSLNACKGSGLGGSFGPKSIILGASAGSTKVPRSLSSPMGRSGGGLHIRLCPARQCAR
eukprot:1077794-Pyramimonas_sp.AAC.1